MTAFRNYRTKKSSSGSITAELKLDQSFTKKYRSSNERDVLLRRQSYSTMVDILPDEKTSVFEEIFYLLLFAEKPISKQQVGDILGIHIGTVTNFLDVWRNQGDLYMVRCRRKGHPYMKIISLANFDKQLKKHGKEYRIANGIIRDSDAD